MSFSHKIIEFLLGPAVKALLPKYVQHAIAEQHRTSEKLISWVLLSTAIIIGILYILSPKPEPYEEQFLIIVIAITLYIIFGLIRLLFSYLNYLPTTFLIISAVADVLVLMIMLFSLHIIYNQPPYFYLKVPALVYVYILLALRTLCYEAKYVIIIGVSAALGWLFLLIYAVIESPAGTVTHNYIEYVTSYHILIANEVNKIIIILLVTAILALAVARSRRLLIRAIAETVSTRELSRFFEPEIATSIIAAEQTIKPGYGEQRHAAILHCDIRGFTEISKHTQPGELIKLLTEYQSKMVKIILNNHGNIDKFLGDGILASFNAIIKNETYVADALRAAIEMAETNELWAVKRNQLGLETFRLGVTAVAGTVTMGVVGDISHMEYTVIGDPVNMSAKLDRYCKIEKCQVLTTEETYQLALQQGFQPTGSIEKLYRRTVEGLTASINLVILKR